MHYYKFHIGDYRKDTGHLKPIEHYIYRSLIDWYYLDEKMIPVDLNLVLRKLSLGKDHCEHLKNVLSDFFIETNDGWEHRKIEEEICDFRRNAEIAKENGKKSAATRYRNGEYMPHEGDLYAVRIDAERVKIGVTANFKSRLHQLKSKYKKDIYLLHKVRVSHMGDAERDLLDAYGKNRSGEELFVSKNSENELTSHMNRIEVAYQVACESHTNHKPLTINHLNTIDTNVSMSAGSEASADGELFDLPKNEIPPCPHQEILKLYKTMLPELPQPRAWNPNDAKTLAARWKWVLTSFTDEGVRRASSKEEGLSWMEFFFTIVKESDFLMGRVKDPRKFEIRWLINPTNFDKVLSGKYDNKDAT